MGAGESKATTRARTRLHEDRWSTYGENTGIRKISARLSVQALRDHDVFQGLSDKVLEGLSQDVSVVEWDEGAILFEEGSYLDLAFVIVDGTVDLLSSRHGDAPAPIFDATRSIHETRAFGVPGPQVAPPTAGHEEELEAGPAPRQGQGQGQRGDQVAHLATIDFEIPDGDVFKLGPGDIFGEIGALNGWPQSVTARAATTCTLLQIRVPALRTLKSRSPSLKARLDEVYRERALLRQLRTTPLLEGCSDQVVNGLARRVELVSCDPGEKIAVEGNRADALYLVRSGFLKLSQKVGEGEAEVVVTYVSKGMTFGDVELLIEGLETWHFSVTSVGYSELVKIARPDFADVMKDNPDVERRLWEGAITRIEESGYTRKHPSSSDLMDFGLAKGLVQGNSILVIDLDVCTRCDDCVRGCADTHGGRPRFVREGDKYGGFLVARSCYHCEDPVCLVGCPTGAIRRANVGDVVEISDSLCIGCGVCAENCPYDAIIMHETGGRWSEYALPERIRGIDRLVASKCDLCYQSTAGPACVSSCPHSCAFRISSLAEFDSLLQGSRPSPLPES